MIAIPKHVRVALYVVVFAGGLILEIAKGIYGATAPSVPWYRALDAGYAYIAMGGGLVALSHLAEQLDAPYTPRYADDDTPDPGPIPDTPTD